MMSRDGKLRIALLGCLSCCLGGCGQPLPPDLQPEAEAVARIREGLTQGVANEPSAGESATSAQPTGFATLRGKFVIAGDAPAPVALSVTKDQNVCSPGGKAVYSNSLIVDSATKGVRNVLVFADKVPAEWVHEDAKPGKADEVVFDQKECVFLTHVVAMLTTQKLRILNSDPVGHNLMVGSFNQTVPAGGYAIYQPNKEQRNPLEMRCAVHPWMQAYFINRDNAYFAVTKDDGTFEIPNLPAGVPLEFRVWHERLAGNINVQLDGQATTWAKGKFNLTLESGSDKELNASLDGAQFK